LKGLDPRLNCPGNGSPLLPSTNTSGISDAVLSPDSRRVAFRRNNSELWVVDTTGHRQPTQVVLQNIQLDGNTNIIDWK
jgi:hypothetical protein